MIGIEYDAPKDANALIPASNLLAVDDAGPPSVHRWRLRVSFDGGAQTRAHLLKPLCAAPVRNPKCTCDTRL